MKGLLMRELHMTWFVGKATILFTLVFGALFVFTDGNLFFLIYPALLFSMLPLSILSTDEHNRWDVYADTLPCTRGQQVSVKYLMSLICTVTVALFTGLLRCLRMLLIHSFIFSDLLFLLLLVAAFSLLSTALCLPFSFRFGMEKGRLMYLCVLGLFGAILFVLASFSSLTAPKMTMPLMLLIAVALFALSWWLSIRLYRKRELH